MVFPRGAVVKNLLANAGDAGDTGSILGSGRSPEVGNGNVLQYFCLEDSMGREPQRATVHGVTELDTTEHTHISAQVTYSDHNLYVPEDAIMYYRGARSSVCNA